MALKDLLARAEAELKIIEDKIREGVITVEDLLGIKSVHQDLVNHPAVAEVTPPAAVEGPAEQASTAIPGASSVGTADVVTSEPDAKPDAEPAAAAAGAGAEEHPAT